MTLLLFGVGWVAGWEEASWVAAVVGVILGVLFTVLQMASTSHEGQEEERARARRWRRQVMAATLGSAVAVALVGMVALTGSAPDAVPGDPPPSPAVAQTSTTKPPFQLPPQFTDVGCVYEVSNDHKLGAQAHQINDGGRVEQEFVATTGYVWTMGLVVGFDPGLRPHKALLALLKEGRVLHREFVELSNNSGTEVRFFPVRVSPGETYVLQLDNTTGIRLGVYMAPRSAQAVKHGERLAAVRIYGEDRTPDRRLFDIALTSCVGAAEVT